MPYSRHKGLLAGRGPSEKRMFVNNCLSRSPRATLTFLGDAPLHYLDLLSQWVQSAMYDGWAWVNRLSLEEWFILLGLTACVGFLAMRGFSNKDRC